MFKGFGYFKLQETVGSRKNDLELDVMGGKRGYGVVSTSTHPVGYGHVVKSAWAGKHMFIVDISAGQEAFSISFKGTYLSEANPERKTMVGSTHASGIYIHETSEKGAPALFVAVVPHLRKHRTKDVLSSERKYERGNHIMDWKTTKFDGGATVYISWGFHERAQVVNYMYCVPRVQINAGRASEPRRVQVPNQCVPRTQTPAN